jgi:hypothetical protein
MFGVTRTPGSIGDARPAASRMQANAAQAVTLGLGRMRSNPPPPLYAYDPGAAAMRGRLAGTPDSVRLRPQSPRGGRWA